MTSVVNGGVVEKQQVLVWASTSNVKPTVALTRRLDAWQHLNGFEHIDFTHQGWEPLNGGHGDFRLAQICALCVLPSRAYDLNGIHFHRLGIELDVPNHILGSVEAFGLGGVTDEGTTQF